jgi:prepilin-type N-terminal cleavage/methylation domain-containing protein
MIRRRGNRRRGYTIIELMVAAVLGAVVVIVGLRWAGTISEIALAAVRVGESRTASVAVDRIGDDLASVRHCESFGRDAVVRSMTPSSITFIADVDADGNPEAVWWRFQDGKLQRSVNALDAGCTPVEPSGWSTQMADVELFSFRPVVAGLASSNTDDYPTCTHIFEAGCSLEAITVRVTRIGSSDSVESTYPITVR